MRRPWLFKVMLLCLAAILVGIIVALHPHPSSSTRSITRKILRTLQSALVQLRRRTGRTPTSMWDFLKDYQSMYAYRHAIHAGVVWWQSRNLIANLSSTMVVPGHLPSPDGTNDLPGVIEVLDTYGYPIQYMPPKSAGSPKVYPCKGEALPSWVPTASPDFVYVSTGRRTAMPPQDSRAPYFYSFGLNGPQKSGSDGGTAGYLYSYRP